MKRAVAIVFVGVIAAVTVLARAPQQAGDGKATESLPSVDQIIDKYVQALGGKAAMEKLTSRVAKGEFDIPAFGASGTLEVYEKAPNSSFTAVDVAGFGMILEGYDGTTAWAQDPQSGLRDKSGDELAAAKLDSEFYKPLKIKELYPKIALKGKEKVGDHDTYLLELTPAQGSVEKWYFDVQTGLLVRSDAERESPQGKMPVEVYFDDYREVDGVKQPFTMRQTTPAFSLSIKLTDVKHNVPVEDSKFKKPSGQ
jgi:hypothetical protein